MAGKIVLGISRFRVPLAVVWIAVVLVYGVRSVAWQIYRHVRPELRVGVWPDLVFRDYLVAALTVVAALIMFSAAFVATGQLLVLALRRSGQAQEVSVRKGFPLGGVRGRGVSVRVWILAGAAAAIVNVLLLSRRVGITGVNSATPLPLDLGGALSYARLIVLPVALILLAKRTPRANANLAAGVIVATVILSALASGSRLVGPILASSLLFLPWGLAKRILLTIGVAWLSLATAMTSRDFVIPWLDGVPINELATPERLWLLLYYATVWPLEYILQRFLGLGELAAIQRLGPLCVSAQDSLISSLTPFVHVLGGTPDCLSMKAVYGLPEDYPGGFGLGFLGNYWYFSGGTPFVFLGLVAALGVLLALLWVVVTKGSLGHATPLFAVVVYVLGLLLAIEARPDLLIALTVVVSLGARVSWLRLGTSRLRLQKHFWKA